MGRLITELKLRKDVRELGIPFPCSRFDGPVYRIWCSVNIWFFKFHLFCFFTSNKPLTLTFFTGCSGVGRRCGIIWKRCSLRILGFIFNSNLINVQIHIVFFTWDECWLLSFCCKKSIPFRVIMENPETMLQRKVFSPILALYKRSAWVIYKLWCIQKIKNSEKCCNLQ